MYDIQGIFLNLRLAIHYTAKSAEILDLKLLVKSIKKMNSFQLGYVSI